MNQENRERIKYPWLFGALTLFVLMVVLLDLKPGHPEVTLTAAVAVLMAILWVSEAIPMAITSFLPLVLFPAFGVLDGKQVAGSYINYIIFLYIGGFIMALAMEKWGLHKRIALKILSLIGGSPLRILIGFAVASSFLSMWMSNTATTMMMLPIAFSVITALEEVYQRKVVAKFSTGLLLGIAYACSIGGVATLVGTPPNLSFIRILGILYPDAPEIAFGQWLIFAFPLTVLMLTSTIILLYRLYRPAGRLEPLPGRFFKDRYKELGPVSSQEKRVFVLFIVLVFMWVFRKSIDLGFVELPGWGDLFKDPEYINDGSIAVFVAILLFIVPSGKHHQGLVTWKITQKIPWNIVFLFGGGFALALAFVESGLSSYVGEELAVAGNLSPFQLTAVMTFTMSLLTEFTSNTATTEMILPITSGIANEISVNPLMLMIPVTLAGSMAFMFPIATPPNAIVFSSNRIHMSEMVKTGALLNIIAVILITLLMMFWGVEVFHIVFKEIPDWAHP